MNETTNPFVIGVTGAVAGGKSTFARFLAELGAVHFDADAEAHAALGEPNVQADVRRRFGDVVFGESGEIDRKALAKIVFDDTPNGRQALDDLEAIVHPAVRRRLEERIQQLANHSVKNVIVVGRPPSR